MSELGLSGLLGLLCAVVLIGGGALLVLDLPGHGDALLPAGGLALSLVGGPVLGLGHLLATLAEDSVALLGHHSFISGGTVSLATTQVLGLDKIALGLTQTVLGLAKTVLGLATKVLRGSQSSQGQKGNDGKGLDI